MGLIEWVATGLGIVCVALGAVRSVWTFPTAIGSVALLGIVVMEQHLYSDTLLQAFFVAANFYGWWNWDRSRAVAGEVAVEVLSNVSRMRWLVVSAVATILWGAGMHRLTDASYPWWDAGIAIASVAAQILMARRKLENWLIWIAVDVASVPLYLVKHLWAFAGLYVIYLALSVWGYVVWRRAMRMSAA